MLSDRNVRTARIKDPTSGFLPISNPDQGSRRKLRKTSHLNVSTEVEDFQADPNPADQYETSPEPKVEELQVDTAIEPNPEPEVPHTFNRTRSRTTPQRGLGTQWNGAGEIVWTMIMATKMKRA
jgi:hypothetical protein